MFLLMLLVGGVALLAAASGSRRPVPTGASVINREGLFYVAPGYREQTMDYLKTRWATLRDAPTVNMPGDPFGKTWRLIDPNSLPLGPDTMPALDAIQQAKSYGDAYVILTSLNQPLLAAVAKGEEYKWASPTAMAAPGASQWAILA